MTQMNVIAHPYAQALFNLAKLKHSEDAWLMLLNELQVLVSDEQFSALLNDPGVETKYVTATIISALGDKATPEVQNFLQVLAENDRLPVITAIYSLFRELVMVDQQRGEAIIESAYAMDSAEIHDFEQILTKKFAKAISVTLKINPDLLAGVKVTINDKVIDGSIKGRLNALATQLTNT